MPLDNLIVSYAVHPAIGIARVGNSPDGYFLAPQVPGEVPAPPYKDNAGAVKRQAAKFRIYGLNNQGQAVKEITADDADIEPATLPSGLSGSRLPHNMVWHRTRVRATMNGPQHMLFACRRQII